MSDHRIRTEDAVGRVLGYTRRIAVLGIKPETHAEQPAHYVPAYAKRAGLEVVPVPVYYPEVTEILGVPVVRSLRAIAGPVDMVVVFRRSADVAQHLDDVLALSPKCLWMQSGISNEPVASTLAARGIDVVEDRCLMVELRLRGR
ncbi:MAG: CoA-binding protein [Myxococcales bacterium]|nr:CoA-binding protein [Myxococcales bacterium]